MNIIEKIKAVFVIKKAADQFQAGPKASWLTGEFWAKVAAAICTMWAGLAGFVPHPIDIYITVGLAILISLERIYLKHKHLEAIVDLSTAPAFDPSQFTQVLGDLISKFPKIGEVVSVPEATKQVEKLVNSASVSSSSPTASVVVSSPPPTVS